MWLGGGSGNGNGNCRSRGWAAFDRDQRRKQKETLHPQNDHDPFPPLPSSSSTSTHAPAFLSYNIKVKELHSWADHSLIQAVDDDPDKTNTCVAASSTRTHPETTNTNTYVATETNPESTNTAPLVQLKDSSFQFELSEDMKRIMERLKTLPIEPEWEDDNDNDVYLRHRKQALRTMRYLIISFLMSHHYNTSL